MKYRIAAILVVSGICIAPLSAIAQSPEEIRSEIQKHGAQIEALNKEIATYEKQLSVVGAQRQTLQNTLDQLNLQRKKLVAQIDVTKSRVRTLQLEIQSLGEDIGDKESSIKVEEAGIAQTLRRLHVADRQSLVVGVLASEELTDVWTDMDASQSIHTALQANIEELSKQKESLTETKNATEEKRAALVKEQKKLVGEQGSLDATRRAQNELLEQTKSQESTYQQILRDKQAAKASFEAALSDLNAQYQRAVDPSSIPAAGKGILRWPLDNVQVTQYFGNTAFARSGAYNGNGHNGVDFRAAVGTPLKAALSGTVIGAGDTGDPNNGGVKGCYSFGKWVMIRHANGLSTMYAHLSQINVARGQSVSTGAIIGYSGATGYATGPHLHFGVYLSEVTEIVKLSQATNRVSACANATMPVPRNLSGYLNPIDYL